MFFKHIARFIRITLSSLIANGHRWLVEKCGYSILRSTISTKKKQKTKTKNRHWFSGFSVKKMENISTVVLGYW